MSEQPIREKIESALSTRYRDRTRNQAEAVDWAARAYLAYLASLNAPAPSDCHVYKNIYGVWRFACSFKTEQDANAMLAKYAPAPSAEPEFATRSEGFPKDGTREPLKFRKKPVVVEARQCSEAESIATLEGTMRADPGDWIITGVKGEKYPCKPDIFAATYEPVSAAPPVSQEGVSEEMTRDFIDECGSVFGDHISGETRMRLVRSALHVALAPLLEKNARRKARIEHWEKTADHHWSARQKLQRELNVVTELYNAGRDAEARVTSLEEQYATSQTAMMGNFKRAQEAEARVKELEDLLKQARDGLEFIGAEYGIVEEINRALSQSEKEVKG